MHTKVQNSQVNCAVMFDGVQEVLGGEGRGEPTMLTKDGVRTQQPEKMANILENSFETKLEEVRDKLVQVLRNMIRGKVRKFKFRMVTTGRSAKESKRVT